MKKKSTDVTKLGGGRHLQKYSTINPLVSICVSINFIDTCLNTLATKNHFEVVVPIKKR